LNFITDREAGGAFIKRRVITEAPNCKNIENKEQKLEKIRSFLFYHSLLYCFVFIETFSFMMKRRMNHLFIGTKTDLASINIAKHFIQDHKWNHIPTDHIIQSNLHYLSSTPHPITNNQLFFYAQQPKRKESLLPADRLFFWIVDHPLLTLNYPNVHFQNLITNYYFPITTPGPSSLSLSEENRMKNQIQSKEDLLIDNVFFVSKHAAASGTVSLTVHPIGIPHLKECGRNGGIAGRCSPPNPHIGSLYRSIYQQTKGQGEAGFEDSAAAAQFTISLEATHHGPFVEIPTCFVEIGSTMEQWSHPTAGRLWSKCLREYFGIEKRKSSEERAFIDELFKDFEQFISAEDEEEGGCSHSDHEGEEGKSEKKTNSETREVLKSESHQIKEEKSLEQDDIVEEEEQHEQTDLSPCQKLDLTKGVAILMIGGGHYVPRMNDMVGRLLRFYFVGN
jgi:D-tyrosyl-tRNA(Tyr) deacylase